MSFTIDGTRWPWPCSIERAAEVRSSEVSGLLMNRNYFNDVIGTYMQYTVSVAIPLNQRDRHTALYEQLTEPVDGHVFVLPYNQTSLTVTGRVENVSDVYVRLAGGGTYWKGLSFTVTANHPTKSMTLNQVLARGRAVVPEIAEHSEGDTWIWVNGGWDLAVEYRNADEIKY